MYQEKRGRTSKMHKPGKPKEATIFRLLFISMREGCAIHEIINDLKGNPVDYKIIDVNPAFERILGLKKEAVVGVKASRLYGSSDPPYLDVYAKVASGGESQYFESFYEPMQRFFSISVFSPERGIFATVFTDITERKINESALQEELNVRANFINILAHEIRAPLSPILSSSQILQEQLSTHPDDKIRRLANNIHSGADVLASRIEELLDLARFTKGSFIPDKKLTNIADYIDEVVKRYRPSVDQSKHTMIVEVAANLPLVEIDQSRIEQVLINLLSNATKYSPKNSQIRLLAKIENNYLVVEVQDHGKGISEIDQLLLFKPYQRLKGDRKNSDGLGLGLSICKQIVEAHDGNIEVVSKLGEGSVFSLKLPLQ
jgi:signal transduction histidine kinase